MRRRRFAIAVHTLDGLAAGGDQVTRSYRCHHPGRTTQTHHLPGQSAPAPRSRVLRRSWRASSGGQVRPVCSGGFGSLRFAAAPLGASAPRPPGRPWPPLLNPALCASHSAAVGGPTRPGLVVAGLRPAI